MPVIFDPLLSVDLCELPEVRLQEERSSFDKRVHLLQHIIEGTFEHLCI